ncbi:hypothetical protein C1645_336069 [Glomus cerebriforme]|uniref:Ribonuclease H1 N-terminal domain-containing protein n=1 Tax=Glomus cerebriforme TaxID=658196 RepID=A0A397TK78_9GLOM|nr:hypothetical protein C1645_336069 [Glomus cerebriforme]
MMVKYYLIRSSFFKEFKRKEFYSTKAVNRPIIKNVPRISLGLNRKSRKSREECEKQVKKYPNARYKKFTTLQDAEAFVKEGNNKKGNSTQEISKCKQQSYSSPVHLSKDGQLKIPDYFSAPKVSNERSLKVWTDGSSLNNGRHEARAGIGVYWVMSVSVCQGLGKLIIEPKLW